MENIDQWVTQLRKGIVELMVLRLLAQTGEIHGYAIVKELQSRGQLIIGESTVYPALKRLESDGLLTPRWSQETSGPPRKYYTLNDAGMSFMRDAGQQWDALVDSMQFLKGDGRHGEHTERN